MDIVRIDTTERRFPNEALAWARTMAARAGDEVRFRAALCRGCGGERPEGCVCGGGA